MLIFDFILSRSKTYKLLNKQDARYDFWNKTIINLCIDYNKETLSTVDRQLT